MNALAKSNMGYVLAPPQNMPTAPIGSTFELSGRIAKKNNVVIDFDSLTQVIGVDSQIPSDAINVFSELLDIIKAMLVSNFDEKVLFYELISNHLVDIGQNPLEVLRNHKYEKNLESIFSGILENDISNYSMHFSSPLDTTDDVNWHDIQIQPSRRADKFFSVVTVYRKSKKQKVDKFVENMEENLRKIFDILKTK